MRTCKLLFLGTFGFFFVVFYKVAILHGYRENSKYVVLIPETLKTKDQQRLFQHLKKKKKNKKLGCSLLYLQETDLQLYAFMTLERLHDCSRKTTCGNCVSYHNSMGTATLPRGSTLLGYWLYIKNYRNGEL